MDPFRTRPESSLTQVGGSSEDCDVICRWSLKKFHFVPAFHDPGKGLLLSIDDPNSDVGHELLPNDEEHKDCIIASPQVSKGISQTIFTKK